MPTLIRISTLLLATAALGAIIVAIEAVAIYRYPATISPVDLDAKYRRGLYAPIYAPPIKTEH